MNVRNGSYGVEDVGLKNLGLTLGTSFASLEALRGFVLAPRSAIDW
jgi:hypothetical protein